MNNDDVYLYGFDMTPYVKLLTMELLIELTASDESITEAAKELG